MKKKKGIFLIVNIMLCLIFTSCTAKQTKEINIKDKLNIIIKNGSLTSSNPFDYIEASQEEYDALLSQPKETFEYAIRDLIETNAEYGLTSYIEALLCSEINDSFQYDFESAPDFLENYKAFLMKENVEFNEYDKYAKSLLASAEVLTDAEISELRSKYPICIGQHPLVDSKSLSLKECIDLAETFVYAEVTENAPKYDGNFYEYSLTVIKDTESIFKKGEQITIAANKIFEDYYPKLLKGMQVVVPVSKDTELEERTYYMVDGMFYVTEEGYVLSVLEEDENMKKSGMTVDELLKQLKK